MGEKPKEIPQETELPSQFSDPEFSRFLERRNIKKEDYNKLVKLITIIDSWGYFIREEILIGHFHNFFNFAKEKSVEKLEEKKDEDFQLKPKNWEEFVDILISLANDYDHYTVDHLLHTLSRIKK